MQPSSAFIQGAVLPMNVVIRADASLRIGTGHVMRCLALAEVLKKRGASVSFVCREFVGNLCDYIEAQGFVVHRMGPSYPAGVSPVLNNQSPIDEPWLEGVTWRQDAAQVKAVLDRFGHRVDWLVVDHYGLDNGWERAARSDQCRVLVIDDLANRPHDCDLLLDQNFKPDAHASYTVLVSKECRLLLGPKYALLRHDFRDLRPSIRIRDGRVQRILIFLGGTDPSNETGKVLRGARRLVEIGVSLDVVIGSMNPHRDGLTQQYGSYGNIHFHHNLANMADLMEQSDLSIGAGGTTSWERCCMGLPSVVITIAENQEPSAQALATAGVVLYLGRKEEVTPRMIEDVLTDLLKAPDRVHHLSVACAGLVDGFGCDRVAAELQARQVPGEMAAAETWM